MDCYPGHTLPNCLHLYSSKQNAVMMVKCLGGVCFSKEEIYTEASKALKSFPSSGSSKGTPNPAEAVDPKRVKLGPLMPAFVDMITYIHDKVCINRASVSDYFNIIVRFRCQPFVGDGYE